MVRNPVFSFRNYPPPSYEELLGNDFFKMALYIASPDFYSELGKREFNYKNLTVGQQNTLKKYYNRACYRAVPFGAFSTVSSARWVEQEDILSFPENKLKVHVKVDYLAGLDLLERVMSTRAKTIVYYKSNTSVYTVSGNFRYLKYQTEKDQLKRTFSIISLSKNKIIAEVLNFCSASKSFEEIKAFLIKLTGSDEADVENYITQLIEEQIVIPQDGTNITGNDCLEEFIQLLYKTDVASDDIIRVNTVLAGLNEHDREKFSRLPQYGNQLRDLLNNPESRKSPFYVVTERYHLQGGVHIKYQKVILDALQCLEKLTPYYRNEALDNFKAAFVEKFENRELPLLFVLDPEVGIGYENLEEVFTQHSLMKDIHFEDISEETERYLKWTPIHSLLLDKLQLQGNEKKQFKKIKISEEDLLGMEVGNMNYKVPPSISVMFRIVDEYVYLESAGGASATSLIGRFSAFGDYFYSMAKEIADKEQSMNREVVFAEIAHACESHSDNINRRKHIREYEIPVLVMSTMPQSTQITLSDLYVSINNNQVILRSKRLNAIVVPRLSSAFNYGNSELSVFRFLCDLQYQGLKLNFKLDLEEFFPGLRFYPRVEYKSAILCLAKWNLFIKDFSFIKNSDSTEWYARFNTLADSIELPDYFALTQHDNHLVFDRKDKDDIHLFLDTIKNYENISLSEYIIDVSEATVKSGNESKPLICQYIAPLYLRENVYGISGNMAFDNKGANNRIFIPGTEWLYFKIYCHSSWSNELLYNILFPLVNNACRRNLINKWFYVRYNDPDYHIRLRVQTINNSTGNIISLFSNKMKGLLNEGIIERYYLDTYVRELERYTPVLIEDIETFFYCSSFLLLRYFRFSIKYGIEYSYSLDIITHSVDIILNAFGLSIEERAILLQKLYSSLFKEFGEGKNLKKSLEKKYNDLRKEISDIYENTYLKERPQFRTLCKKLSNVSSQIARKVKKKKLLPVERILSDMLHMHLNRVFIQNPRKQEMIVYYLLYKHYNSLYYKGKSTAG